MADTHTQNKDGRTLPLSFFYSSGTGEAGLVEIPELEELANGVSPLFPSDGKGRASKEDIIQGGDPRLKIRLLVAATEVKKRGREFPLTAEEKKELQESAKGWGKFKTCRREAEILVKIGKQTENLYNNVSSSLSVLAHLLNRREDWRERVRFLTAAGANTETEREEVARKMTELLRLEIEATVTPGQGEGGEYALYSKDGVLKIEQTGEGFSLNEDGIRALIETEARKAEKALADFKAFSEEIDKYIKKTTLQYYPLSFVWSVRRAINGDLAVFKRPLYNSEYIDKKEREGGRVPPDIERVDIVPSFVEIEAPEDAKAEAWELIRAAEEEEELLETKETKEETPARHPKNFIITREAALNLPASELDLFTKIGDDPSMKYRVSGELFKKITPLDLAALSFALSQLLYNQSLQSGNEKILSGNDRVKDTELSEALGFDVFRGQIAASLYEITRLAYGVQTPTFEQKKKIDTVLSNLHRNPVIITFSNGTEQKEYLVNIQREIIRKKDQAKIFSLSLHGIFSLSYKGFGVLPQKVIFDLEEFCRANRRNKSAEDYKLLRWLSAQDKRTPHTLTIEQIVRTTEQEESFKKDRGRTEKKLLLTFAAMVGIKILTRYEIEYKETAKGNRINKVTFYLNKEYTKETAPQRIEEAGKDE